VPTRVVVGGRCGASERRVNHVHSAKRVRVRWRAGAWPRGRRRSEEAGAEVGCAAEVLSQSAGRCRRWKVCGRCLPLHRAASAVWQCCVCGQVPVCSEVQGVVKVGMGGWGWGCVVWGCGRVKCVPSPACSKGISRQGRRHVSSHGMLSELFSLKCLESAAWGGHGGSGEAGTWQVSGGAVAQLCRSGGQPEKEMPHRPCPGVWGVCPVDEDGRGGAWAAARAVKVVGGKWRDCLRRHEKACRQKAQVVQKVRKCQESRSVFVRGSGPLSGQSFLWRCASLS